MKKKAFGKVGKAKGYGGTGPIDRLRGSRTGKDALMHASHGKHNKAYGLPADAYAHDGEGAMEGPEGENETCM